MPTQANRRMPLSCEPCRERKIRCPRTSSSPGGPCATCVRRGVPADQCVFLREVYGRRAARPQIPAAAAAATGAEESREASNSELLERIRKLESLVGSNANIGARRSTAEVPTALSPFDDSGDGQASTPMPSRASRGTLVKSVSGHERYEPLSSKWSSVLASSQMADGMSCEVDALATESEFPFTTGRFQLDDVLSALPAMSHCDQLKDVFLSVFAPLFHVLHDPTFLADYARFRSQPETMPLSWLALLFAVLSIAVTALDEGSDLLRDLGKSSDASKSISTLTSRYRAAAFRCLEGDQYLWRHNLQTLQALILLIYGINHSHGQSWALLGLTRNVALSLGCHVDPDHFGLDLVEAEQRRRCWAALTMLYMIQNTCLGSIDTAPIQSSVRLPLDVDDDQLAAGPAAARTPVMRSDTPSQMSYLLYKFRLYDICARICNHLFSESGPPSYDAISAFDREISAQQDAWNIKYLRDTRHSSLPNHHAVHLNILFGYSHQLFLLLHRPVLQQAHTEGGSTQKYAPSQVLSSRTRCLESASALLEIHRLLYENDAFRPFQWYNHGLGSFHAFHAAVFIAYICGTSTDLDAEYLASLRREVEASVSTFEAIAATGMSRICEKAAPVLRRLSATSCLFAQRRVDPPHEVPQTLLPLSPPLSGGSEGQPYSPSMLHTSSQQQLEAFLETLQPRQWLSPAAITWNDWDLIVDGCPTSQGCG
ncbi:hypothetical protein CONLIGDRAFT_625604 [Coniochaeta ligniaria NRRL 30616]|uniref:Zn(2)-C6 fungal-type domain-containing protein n=1 Tax=Coniochaeta ligniaria NRRL 30616 TaxID=1408157 RepID=A0A1J7I639_9PEZI|nr:hypothetical protein CONLIGDRAFT_625604 [Coniochaeta ligniaria NRRL 30616]